MSLYKQAWLFSIWFLIVICSFPYWLFALGDELGAAGYIIGAIILGGHWVAGELYFYCPDCGLSPYRSNKGLISRVSPIPSKKCAHCGYDYNAAPPSAEV
ncbi:hypothetical protein AAIB41_12685 [Brucella sp. BE17]|uniref:hypothetical protein n=1 Tax=Brucella sp. BE17 TaxID=3142977 RepID=UPI0031B9D92D